MISWHNVGQISPAAVNVICHPDVSVGANKERRRVSNCVRRSGSAAASRLDEKQSGRPVCFGRPTQWGQGANGGGEGEGWVVGGGLNNTTGFSQRTECANSGRQKKHVLPLVSAAHYWQSNACVSFPAPTAGALKLKASLPVGLQLPLYLHVPSGSTLTLNCTDMGRHRTFSTISSPHAG